jgi:ribosomal-protein-alanine N-acetyltransferase
MLDICKTLAIESISLRGLIRRDMPEVLRIEAESFEFPWQLNDFLLMLHQRNNNGMVAESSVIAADRCTQTVVGYMVYELHKDSIHLVNLAVDKRYRRQEIGRQLIQKLIKKLSAGAGLRQKVTCEVRERNVAAQLFFRAVGFRAVAVFRGMYKDTSEDAYAMMYSVRK